MWRLEIPEGAEPAGYRFLVEHFNIQALPHYRWSYTGPKWDSRQVKFEELNLELHFYPRSYRVEGDIFRHLEFALKYEGLNLLIIKQVIASLHPDDITRYILESPTGKYVRKIWFLFEFLMGDRLPIDDIGRGSYVHLLDPEMYYCAAPKRSSRHRVVNNLLGDAVFCPLVRRSSRLSAFEGRNMKEEIERIAKRFDSDALARAMRYLYTKETMASWEIEREKPDRARLNRFVALLERAEGSGELSKRMLVEIQKEIVDPRFLLENYRSFQNYVGEGPAPGEIMVHFVAPRPEDIQSLMDGLIACVERMFGSDIHPVVAATVLSFGFVFLHPFWDGNGRLHRFLIHYTLSKLGFAPKGFVFPVSAAMLREPRAYDLALESFSRPLSKLITDYEFNDSGAMIVRQDTADYYSFIDFTAIAEYLFQCVERTVHTDFEAELNFLTQYDKIKVSIKQIVDMPDQLIDLFIRCVRQNGGTLSERKRDSHFKMLTDQEIEQMESVIRLVSGIQ